MDYESARDIPYHQDETGILSAVDDVTNPDKVFPRLSDSDDSRLAAIGKRQKRPSDASGAFTDFPAMPRDESG
jgi:hypothetical protein